MDHRLIHDCVNLRLCNFPSLLIYLNCKIIFLYNNFYYIYVYIYNIYNLLSNIIIIALTELTLYLIIRNIQKDISLKRTIIFHIWDKIMKKRVLHEALILIHVCLIIFHPTIVHITNPRIYSAKRGNLFANLLKNRVGGDEQSNSGDKHEVTW